MTLESRRGQEDHMEGHTPDFSLDVQGVTGSCPAGEAHVNRQIAARRSPVLSCEGLFSMDDVPEQELKVVARQVADKIIATMEQVGELPARRSSSRFRRGGNAHAVV